MPVTEISLFYFCPQINSFKFKHVKVGRNLLAKFAQGRSQGEATGAKASPEASRPLLPVGPSGEETTK